MGNRLKTSNKTKIIFEELEKRMKLQPYALAKIAISLSLKDKKAIDSYESDNQGLELNRSTVFNSSKPEYARLLDMTFKALMEAHAKHSLTDDEFYPEYTKKHIDRGAILLKAKYDYATNMKSFVSGIVDEVKLV